MPGLTTPAPFVPPPPPERRYCDGLELVRDRAGTISDGSAGGEYMPRSTCGWIIEPVISKDNPCTACVITLYFREMDLEAPHDYIKVYEALKFQPKNPLLDFELETSRSTMESMLSWIDIETAVPARPSSK